MVIVMEKNNFTTKLLEIITEDQILQIVKDFGALPYKIKENEIWFKTICHGGDSHKLCYFRNSKEFYCYTNCGKMNLFSFIMNVKDWTFKETINFLQIKLKLSNRKGFHKSTDSNSEYNEIIEKELLMKDFQEKDFNEAPLEKIEDNILDYFEDIYYTGWIDEGISIETMQKYNIKWYGLENHIIIPHYDIQDNLVGIRRRTLQERELLWGTKYMPETIQGKRYTHSLNFNLYGLNKNKKAIEKHKKAIIVEAEKSVLLSDSFYGENSITVATCGFNISNWQKEILLKLGVTEIILAFDKDFNPKNFEDIQDINDLNYKRYLNFCDRLTKFSNSFTQDCVVSVLWDEYELLNEKDSPFDRGKEIFETLYRKRVKMDKFTT
jgi:hypothetical protein